MATWSCARTEPLLLLVLQEAEEEKCEEKWKKCYFKLFEVGPSISLTTGRFGHSALTVIGVVLNSLATPQDPSRT